MIKSFPKVTEDLKRIARKRAKCNEEYIRSMNITENTPGLVPRMDNDKPKLDDLLVKIDYLYQLAQQIKV